MKNMLLVSLYTCKKKSGDSKSDALTSYCDREKSVYPIVFAWACVEYKNYIFINLCDIFFGETIDKCFPIWFD